MAEILGGNNILNLALPTGVDGTRIAQWEMRAGLTWGEFLARVANALGGFNNQLMMDWGDMFFITEELMMEYPNGGSITSSPVITDIDVLDPISETTIGHMLDLLVHGDAVGGTRRWFRDARERQILAQVRGVTRRLKEAFEEGLLTRLLTNTETSVGTSGYNVPVVRGTSGNVDFTPVAYGGETFASTHDHFLGIDSNTYGYADAFNQLAETLEEHGHEAPYQAIVSRSDIDTIYALPGFAQPVAPTVVYVDRGTTTANTGAGFYTNDQRNMQNVGHFESHYGVINIKATARVPQYYAALYKSYGNNNEMNPLAVRVHPDEGFGARIVAQSNNDPRYPIETMRIEFEYGIGVGEDRTNGAAAYLVSGGVWVNPTIS
jgi:hypothetical protein